MSSFISDLWIATIEGSNNSKTSIGINTILEFAGVWVSLKNTIIIVGKNNFAIAVFALETWFVAECNFIVQISDFIASSRFMPFFLPGNSV